MGKGKIINFTQANKKKYFLVVSDDECVLECWADSHKDLVGITNIYDDKGQPFKVSIIIDVLARRIYEVKR